TEARMMRCHSRAFGGFGHYWITSSARSSSDGGIVTPSTLAVLRLMTKSNFVGSSTLRADPWRGGSSNAKKVGQYGIVVEKNGNDHKLFWDEAHSVNERGEGGKKKPESGREIGGHIPEQKQM